MRTFIAIELSKGARNEAARLTDKIIKKNIIRANFVNPENLHLTLKFLGEISEQETEKIKEKLSEIKQKSFDVSLGKIGFFSPNFVKVLWIELLCKENEIQQLQGQIENKLEEIGFIKEKREFQSHITLARVKSLRDKQGFLDFIEKTEVKKIDFRVKSFKLISSELTPEGPIYKTIQEFGLTP